MRKRCLVVIFALLACALACMAGWFFQRAGGPPLPPGGWQTEFADGRSSVSVWRTSGTAASAAAAREAAYVSDGWTLVSCGRFPLGFGKRSGGILKNKYLAGWRYQ